MRQSRFSVEQVIRVIAESELPTASIAGTARKYGIKEATLYRWRAKYKGLNSQEGRRLQILEDENRRLTKLVAEKELILQSLDEILKKSSELGSEAASGLAIAPSRSVPAGGLGLGPDEPGPLFREAAVSVPRRSG